MNTALETARVHARRLPFTPERPEILFSDEPVSDIEIAMFIDLVVDIVRTLEESIVKEKAS